MRSHECFSFLNFFAPLDSEACACFLIATRSPVLGRGKTRAPPPPERTAEMEAILAAERALAEQVAEQRRLTGVIALPDGTHVKRSASVFEPGDSKSHPNPDQTPAALAAATANAQAKEAARLRSLAHGGQDPGEGGCAIA